MSKTRLNTDQVENQEFVTSGMKGFVTYLYENMWVLDGAIRGKLEVHMC